MHHHEDQVRVFMVWAGISDAVELRSITLDEAALLFQFGYFMDRARLASSRSSSPDLTLETALPI